MNIKETELMIFDNNCQTVEESEPHYTSRNQPKCNQSIYDYMQLAVVCN
jgi:hypothetical protein